MTLCVVSLDILTTRGNSIFKQCLVNYVKIQYVSRKHNISVENKFNQSIGLPNVCNRIAFHCPLLASGRLEFLVIPDRSRSVDFVLKVFRDGEMCGRYHHNYTS